MTKDILNRVTFRPYTVGPVFRLVTWDTHATNYGKPCLGYRLQQIDADGKRRTIFQGEDFGCSPLHSIDGKEALRALMGFLTLRPGDTDREYFAGYSKRQLAFASEHAEALSAAVADRLGCE